MLQLRIKSVIKLVLFLRLCNKVMLQKTWKMGITWDEAITSDLKDQCIEWFHE